MNFISYVILVQNGELKSNILLYIVIILVSLSTAKTKEPVDINSDLASQFSEQMRPTSTLRPNTNSRDLNDQRKPQEANEKFAYHSFRRHVKYPDIINKITRQEPPGTYAATSDVNKDCLMLCQGTGCELSRGIPRKYPGRCYDITKQTIYWNLWNEISHDFSFTFDYVLWDDNKIPTQYNQFWYLILYLKSLVDHIGKPFDILSESNLRKELTELQNYIIDVTREYDLYRSYKSSIIKSMIDINEKITKFENEKSIVSITIKRILDDVGNYDKNSKFMEEKIKDIDTEMLAIKSSIDQFADTTLGKFHAPHHILGRPKPRMVKPGR